MNQHTLFVLLLFFCGAGVLPAQTLIAVQNGGNPGFYTSLDSAVHYAQAGDSVFIPGGYFVVGNPGLLIDKTLHLIGVGVNPDSLTATGITQLSNSIILISGADHGSITGLFTQAIVIGTDSTNQTVNNLKIESCTFTSGIFIRQYGSLPNASTGFLIQGNRTGGGGGIAGSNSTSHIITNNQVGYLSDLTGGCQINNNIITRDKSSVHTGNAPLVNVTYSTFDNNIFLTGQFYFSGVQTGCIYRNNVCKGPSLGINSISGQSLAATFENWPNGRRLKATSPGKNHGIDGTDVGLYGGLFPWKPGNIPFHPHIQARAISPTTDNGGQLNVNIKVQAQDY